MATKPSVLLFVILVVATASSTQGGIIQPIPPINQTAVVFVRFGCSSSGKPGVGIPPLVNATVSLSCDGRRTTVAQGITDANGATIIAVNASSVTQGGLSNFLPTCVVYVRLPVANCTALPLKGTLRAALTQVDNVVLRLLGFLLAVVTGAFEVVAGIP